jgi:hypothetical protein
MGTLIPRTWSPTPCCPVGTWGNHPWRRWLATDVSCFVFFFLLSLNLATRSAFGGAPLVHGTFIETFSGSSLSGVPLAGDLWEWRSIETIPQWGIGWEADTPASDALFGASSRTCWEAGAPVTCEWRPGGYCANPTIQPTSQPRPQSKLHPNVELFNVGVNPESTSESTQSQRQSQPGVHIGVNLGVNLGRVNRLTPCLIFLKLRDLLSAPNPLCTDISRIWHSALFAP